MTWREEIIGDARLICADCREVLPTLGKVDAVVTDPPYSIPHDFAPMDKGRKGIRTLRFEWDNNIDVAGIVDACRLAAEQASAAFIFCGLRQATPLAEMLCALGMTDKMASWVKLCPTPPAPGNWWPSGFEMAVYGYRPGAHFKSDNRTRSNVFYSDSYRFGQPGKVDHPTQKPLAMIGEIVEPMVPQNGTCLDPFMGSGTTGVACAQLGRKFIGIEIEEKYFTIACRRIEEAYRQPRLFKDEVPKPKQAALL